MSESDTLVSHEQDGRILEGIGADVDTLQETMERHAPKEPVTPQASPAPEPAQPAPARNEAGQFAKAPEPEKKTRGQKRFDELTAEREAAKREADELRRELDQLRARPTPDRSSPTPPAPSAQAAPAHPQKPAPATRPKPSEEQIGVTYQTYGEYVEDLADWKAEQRISQIDFDARLRASLEADRASRSQSEKVSKVLDAGRQAFPDFEAVRATSDVMFPQPVLDLILSLDNAPHVIYQLAKDRALAEQIATSNPYQAGLLLARLVTPAPVASPASTARTVAPPPAPYQPVAGGSKTSVPSSATLASATGDDYDRSGYRESRARERGVRSRW